MPRPAAAGDSLFTDYTFGLWNDEDPPQLVSFAKAYSGLDDAEILELDRWIRRNTVQRFRACPVCEL